MDEQFWGCELTFTDGDRNSIPAGGVRRISSRLVSSTVSPERGCYIRLRRMILMPPKYYEVEAIASVMVPVAVPVGGGNVTAQEVALGTLPRYEPCKPRPRHLELDLRFDTDFAITLAPIPGGYYDVKSVPSLRLHLSGSRGAIPSTVQPPRNINCHCRSEIEKLEQRIRSLEEHKRAR